MRRIAMLSFVASRAAAYVSPRALARTAARGARAVARVALRALGLLDEARVEGQEVLRPYARLWHRFWLNTVMRPFVSVWEAHVARPARRVFGLLAEVQAELIANEKAGLAF